MHVAGMSDQSTDVEYVAITYDHQTLRAKSLQEIVRLVEDATGSRRDTMFTVQTTYGPLEAGYDVWADDGCADPIAAVHLEGPNV